MTGWIPNPNWQTLDDPEEGDIVQLKHEDGFGHLIKLKTLSVSGNIVSGFVEAVFDWDTKGQTLSGDMKNLEGKQMDFDKQYMQNVIKKP